jgi:hypothetical protein
MEANDPSVSVDLLIKGLVSLDVTVPEFGKIFGEKKPATMSARAVTHTFAEPRVFHFDLRLAKSPSLRAAAKDASGRIMKPAKAGAKKK